VASERADLEPRPSSEAALDLTAPRPAGKP
jgi:hypothetical protein